MSDADYRSAAEHGLMQGFPPAPDKQVTASNGLTTPPFNRWAYLNMRSLYPSVGVALPPGPSGLKVTPDPAIGELCVPRPDGTTADLGTWLTETYNDSLVVVQGDAIVFESYANGMHSCHPHQMMSCTKSFAGLFALKAIADGLASEDDLVGELVPELAASGGFGSSRFGDVLDMVNSILFSEQYDDPDADVWRYARLIGWSDELPEPGDPDNINDYLVATEKNPEFEHGEIFQYQSPKTDAVNWITSRLTGRSFVEHLTDLWADLGAEAETYVLVDRRGTLVAAGGLNAAPRDLARFAIMLLADGMYDGRSVFPADMIELLRTGADRAAFARGPEAKGFMADGNWSYRAQWWIRHTPGREAITGIGVHGQWIYIDHAHQVAIIKQSSDPVTLDLDTDEFIVNGFDAIIDHLTDAS